MDDEPSEGDTSWEGDRSGEGGEEDHEPDEVDKGPDQRPDGVDLRPDGVDHEPGEEYDCDACGGTHVVEESKGLRVAGSSEGLDPTAYVRCPEAGVIRLADDESDAATANGVVGDDDQRDDDWP